MKHEREVSLAFEMGDVGPPSLKNKNGPTDPSRTASTRSNSAAPSGRKENPNGESYVNTREAPPHPFPICVRNCSMHLMKYSNESNDDEKDQMKKEWAKT